MYHTTPQKGFYNGYFPQLAAVVQPLLLGALQSLTAVLLKTATNCLQRFLYNNRYKIPFYSGFSLKTAVNMTFYNSFNLKNRCKLVSAAVFP
jgi:hypothetical protein